MKYRSFKNFDQDIMFLDDLNRCTVHGTQLKIQMTLTTTWKYGIISLSALLTNIYLLKQNVLKESNNLTG